MALAGQVRSQSGTLSHFLRPSLSFFTFFCSTRRILPRALASPLLAGVRLPTSKDQLQPSPRPALRLQPLRGLDTTTRPIPLSRTFRTPCIEWPQRRYRSGPGRTRCAGFSGSNPLGGHHPGWSGGNLEPKLDRAVCRQSIAGPRNREKRSSARSFGCSPHFQKNESPETSGTRF